MTRFLVAGAVFLAACAPQTRAPTPAGPRQASAAPRAARDTSALVPPGYGTLRQDDVALRMMVANVQIRAIPLEESIIRVLSPDSYRSLHGLRESRRDAIERLAARYLLRERNVWLVTFFGLAPDARFSPQELTLGVAGRDFRALEIVPLTNGFGEQRVSQNQTQSALYLFPDGVDPEQPILARMESARDDSWGTIQQRIERERALARSRAQAAAGRNP